MDLSLLEAHRIAAGFDAFRIPSFAQSVLGFEPAVLQRELEARYPVRHKGDTIVWADPQWIEGDKEALKYGL